MSSEDEVKVRVDALRKTYFDAKHHCFAYRIGHAQERTRAFDDGEPAHSAGHPILGQIVAHGLTDTLVVVVRYFGGILLGVGRLMQAYRTAAQDALDRAPAVRTVEKTTCVLQFGYAATGAVNRVLRTYAAETSDYRNDSVCSVTVKIRTGLADAMLKELGALRDVRVTLPEKTVQTEEMESNL